MTFINDKSVEDGFWQRVFRDEQSGCWIWTGTQHDAGYGAFRRTLAHRWAYKHFVHDIPKEVVLDHKCRNRLCVNPEHLEEVTLAENSRRGHQTYSGRREFFNERRRKRRQILREVTNANIVRFFKLVQVIPSGCWLWHGTLNASGYGVFLGKKRAHRWSYETFVGQITENMNVDHKCRVRNCVNPNHLEPVTSKENTLRGEGITAKNAKKTHCPKGHPYTGENLYVAPDGKRRCKTCMKAASDRVREKIKASPELQEKVRTYHRRKSRESNNRLGIKQGVPNKDKKYCPQGHAYSDENMILDSKGQRRCRICRKEQQTRKHRKKHPIEPKVEKTHCPQGHSYSGTNLMISSKGVKRCRICVNESTRRSAAKRKSNKDQTLTK